MEIRKTKETDGRGRNEQCSDKKDEDRRLRGGRASARKTNGERTRESMACRKVTGEKVTVDEGGNGTGEERSSCDRRKEEWKKGNESKCAEREVNNRDDDRTKRGRGKGTTEKAAGRRVNDQVDATRRSYSEAVIE